jgi:hypothetical protein
MRSAAISVTAAVAAWRASGDIKIKQNQQRNQ